MPRGTASVYLGLHGHSGHFGGFFTGHWRDLGAERGEDLGHQNGETFLHGFQMLYHQQDRSTRDWSSEKKHRFQMVSAAIMVCWISNIGASSQT